MSGRSTVLSTSEREQGLASFMKHISWNGLGVFLLNNTVVSLMAIHFGATNLELGYINAAFHVTGVVSLVVPRILPGRRISRVFGWAWMSRGGIAVFYGLLLFLSGPVARGTILVVFTGFCLARAVGVSVAHAVQRDVMRDRDVGGSLARVNIRLGLSQFLAQLLSFGLLSLAFFQGIEGLVTIAYIGVIMNTVASLHLLRIPGRSVIEESGQDTARRNATRFFRNRNHAVPMFVHSLGMGLHVLFAFQVVFLRRALDLPDSVAILFTVVGAAAAIVANLGLRPFADSVGERPLLILITAGLVAISLAWAFIPATLPVPVYFVLGFIAFFFLRSLLTLKSAALVKSIPDRNRISYTATTNVLLGIVALLLGLAGGALADVARDASVPTVHEYTYTFLLTAVIAVITMVLSVYLPERRGLSLRETTDIMLSPRNLRAFLDANQLDFVGDPARRESLLLSLERSSTPVATSRLRERLNGPSVAERERVFRILFRSPRMELLADILEEARDRQSYTRRDAIFCLGAYRDCRAQAVLREIVSAETGDLEAAMRVSPAGAPPSPAEGSLSEAAMRVSPVGAPPSPPKESIFEVPLSPPEASLSEAPPSPPEASPEASPETDRADPAATDREAAAIALKSLARHGCTDVLPVIRKLINTSLSARAELDLAVAESILEPDGCHLEYLFERSFARGSERFASTRLLVALDRLGRHPELEGYVRVELNDAGRGFVDLLEDASEFEVILQAREQLSTLVEQGRFHELWARIAEILQREITRELWDEAEAGHARWVGLLARSVLSARPTSPELARVGSLAALYVLYHSLDAVT